MVNGIPLTCQVSPCVRTNATGRYWIYHHPCRRVGRPPTSSHHTGIAPVVRAVWVAGSGCTVYTPCGGSRIRIRLSFGVGAVCVVCLRAESLFDARLVRYHSHTRGKGSHPPDLNRVGGGDCGMHATGYDVSGLVTRLKRLRLLPQVLVHRGTP